jgi:AraC family transcriptional regulator
MVGTRFAESGHYLVGADRTRSEWEYDYDARSTGLEARLASLPGYRNPLVAFRMPEAPSLVSRKLYKSTLALTEIQGAERHGLTASIPYDDAYLVQLRLRDCPRCEYFYEGRHVPLADRRAGVILIHDLRRDPVVDLQDPFHVMHMYLPRRALNGLAEEAGAAPMAELHIDPGNCIRDSIVENLFLSLRPALASPEEANALFVDHVALALSSHVARAYGGMQAFRPAPRGGLAPWQERRTKEYLDADLGGDISLKQLAMECGLSVRQFSRGFRQSVGVPPYRYLLKRRVEKARQLLKDPTLSLLDVALACGFADQSHFTRVFNASVGISPGLWRRVLRAPR